jgi:hypothetical protein
VEHVWKIQIPPYNRVNLNSHYGRSRHIRILGNFPYFSNQFEPPIN